MKGDAIKAVVAKLGGPVEPTDEETIAAIREGVDLALDLFGAVHRLAVAAERLADCVSHPNDPGVSATFGVHQN